MRLVAVEQLQMQVAARLVGETLEKLACQAEAERTGHILIPLALCDRLLCKLIQTTPDQMRPAAEVDDTTSQTFIHGHVGFAGKWVLGMKTGAVAANALLVAERPRKCLSQHDPTILDRVVRVHVQITPAVEVQIHDGMPGKQGQHVVEERNAGFDFGPARTVETESDRDARFFC